MKLVQSILTKNPCYTAGRKITVKGLMSLSIPGTVHPTAMPVFTDSSMAMTAPSIRLCLGTIADGMQAVMPTTLISV